MTTSDKELSRRNFLRMLGIAAAMPLVSRAALAQDETTASASAGLGAQPIAKKAEGAHRVLTCNILLASPAHDGTPFAWIARKELCEKIMRNHDPDIICMQEVLRPQAEDLRKDFSNFFQYGFEGPFMDANPDGYHGVTKNVLMFMKNRYELISAGNYWLSETPLIAGSVSWDALRGRHVNWLRLKDRSTGKQFRVLDTHFDHKGQTARENQARMIVKEAARYKKDFPQILCGDFNADMHNPVYPIITGAGWTDTYTALHGDKEPGNTYHKMKGPAYKNKNGKIDFIFTHGEVKALASQIIKDNDNGHYPSDHYFVSADLVI